MLQQQGVATSLPARRAALERCVRIARAIHAVALTMPMPLSNPKKTERTSGVLDRLFVQCIATVRTCSGACRGASAPTCAAFARASFSRSRMSLETAAPLAMRASLASRSSLRFAAFRARSALRRFANRASTCGVCCMRKGKEKQLKSREKGGEGVNV